MNLQRDLFSDDIIPVKIRRRTPQLRQSNGYTKNGEPRLQLDGTSEALVERIASLEKKITELRDIISLQQPSKESYSTQEIASILDRKPYTVREWCRLRRINAFKTMCGRGCEEEWRVSHDELVRIQNEGLLPIPKQY